MTTYCEYCNSHPEDTFNRNYHDTQYGFPLADDNALFEHLVLEINQAGLSWITILKKAGNFHRAYDGFDVETVAGYGESDRARLPWTVRRPPVPAVLAQAGQAGVGLASSAFGALAIK